MHTPSSADGHAITEQAPKLWPTADTVFRSDFFVLRSPMVSTVDAVTVARRNVSDTITLRICQSATSPTTQGLMLLFVNLDGFRRQASPDLSTVKFSISLATGFNDVRSTDVTIFSPPQMRNLDAVNNFHLRVRSQNDLNCR